MRDAERSLQFDQYMLWLELTQMRGNKLQFFSLQLGLPASQLQAQLDANPQLPVIDLTTKLHDWADTAALVANLDLVITCCTAVAHLACAMGKPTWILLHSEASWRWFPKQDSSPWYPSARLFWQKNRRDWTDVLQEVRQALLTLNQD